jgi:hypothetical protein
VGVGKDDEFRATGRRGTVNQMSQNSRQRKWNLGDLLALIFCVIGAGLACVFCSVHYGTWAGLIALAVALAIFPIVRVFIRIVGLLAVARLVVWIHEWGAKPQIKKRDTEKDDARNSPPV